MKMNTKSKGFTMIELIVVIAIISILASVVMTSLNSARVGSRNAARLGQVDQIQKAIELSVTGTTNQLPVTTGWICLGAKTPCAVSATLPSGYNNDAVLNTLLSRGIAGGIIPTDPSIATGIGDAYLYNSNVAPTTQSATNGCSAVGSCPAGAYLSWVIENSNNCGRGVYWLPVGAGNQCVLRLGDSQ